MPTNLKLGGSNSTAAVGRNSLYYFCIHVVLIKFINKIVETIVSRVEITRTVQGIISIAETLITIVAVWCILKVITVLRVVIYKRDRNCLKNTVNVARESRRNI